MRTYIYILFNRLKTRLLIMKSYMNTRRLTPEHNTTDLERKTIDLGHFIIELEHKTTDLKHSITDLVSKTTEKEYNTTLNMKVLTLT